MAVRRLRDDSLEAMLMERDRFRAMAAEKAAAVADGASHRSAAPQCNVLEPSSPSPCLLPRSYLALGCQRRKPPPHLEGWPWLDRRICVRRVPSTAHSASPQSTLA